MRHPHPTRTARRLAATLAAICLSGVSAQAQLRFTEFSLTDSTLNSSPTTDFWMTSAAPADVDADGDVDLLVAGYYVVYPFTTAEERLTLYRNDGAANDSTWALTPVSVDPGTLTFETGDIAWGDYDHDGDPDVVVAGAGEMALYRNDGGGRSSARPLPSPRMPSSAISRRSTSTPSRGPITTTTATRISWYRPP